MRRYTLGMVAAGGLLLAACGGGDDGGASGSAALSVRVTAPQVGLGCTGAHPLVGNGSQLVVEDDAGKRVAVGTFQLTPGAEICDWTATASNVPADSDIYVLKSGGKELATIDPDAGDVAWDVTVTGGIDGSVDRVTGP